MPSNNIKLRFKTKEQNGILFYASGNQRDYLSLELIQGRLVMHIDLGKYFHGTVEAVVVVIVWSLDLRHPLPITCKVVSLNPIHGKVYSIQYYVRKFVSDF